MKSNTSDSTSSPAPQVPHPPLAGAQLPPGQAPSPGPELKASTEANHATGASNTARTVGAPRTFFQHLQRAFAILLVLNISLSGLVVMGGLPVLFYLNQHRQRTVKSVQPAGHVTSVTLSQGLFTRSLIQTDLGFYAVAQGVSLQKDQPLSVELRANSDRFLCDDKHVCLPLM